MGVLTFFKSGLWERDIRTDSWPRRWSWTVLRVITHVVRSYDKDHVGLRAGGLSLMTLLAIVPMLAIAFAVAEGFGYRDSLDRELERGMSDLPQYLADAVTQVRSLVDRTSFSALGWVSSLVLTWSGLSLFVQVESALNHAWRSKSERAWLSRATTFISLIFVAPLLLLGALVVESALRTNSVVEWLKEEVTWLLPLYDAGLWLVPHVMTWIAFAALYKGMPATRVRWRPAIIAGMCAGSALLFVHGAYVHFQIGVARANAIYAALATLPLLLVYLTIAWTVVLLGADVGYAVQNLHLIGPGREVASMSPALRERLAFALVQESCRRFDAGEGPLSLSECAASFDLPAEWVQAVADELVKSGVLTGARGGCVIPSRPSEMVDAASARGAVLGTVPAGLRERLKIPEDLQVALDQAGAASAETLERVRFDA